MLPAVQRPGGRVLQEEGPTDGKRGCLIPSIGSVTSMEGSYARTKVVGNKSREIGRDKCMENLVCVRKDFEFYSK